jgi:hypothetical protein
LKVRADLIKRALAKRHTDDFFLTEVKNGPTHFARDLLIMDAMAIKKSWANPCITVYEVKVDRQDFLRDEKWPGYRAYCHRLYFACPAGLIQPEELPEDVGMVWYNVEKGTLYTKKKAHHREIDISSEMLYYILMSKVQSDRHPFFNSQRELLEAYVQDKEDRVKLGWSVKSKLIDRINELEREIEKLKRYKDDAELLGKIRSILKEAGIDNYYWCLEDNLRKALSTKQSPKVIEIAERMKRDAEQLYALTQKAE